MEPAEILALLRDFGLPTAMLVALIWLLVKAGRWVGTHVFLPMVEAHVNFLATIQKSVEEHTAGLKRLNDSSEQLVSGMVTICRFDSSCQYQDAARVRER
jgi:hypothetical protein